MKMYKIGIIGLGVLGTAIFETFKTFAGIELCCCDKYNSNAYWQLLKPDTRRTK